MLKGCKLDPTLISTLVERWRLEKYTFYLPCGECTITLKDVALQLSLSMDESFVMGLVVVPNKEDLLRKVSNKIYDGWIDMKWLKTNFKEFPTDTPNIVKEQYALAFILRLIGGILIPDKSQNLEHIR
ncbi:hypothetical protein PVK06_024781 [Gossypium arboreum]|uniref:Aminotransferase-like plant mobile domain-containing protein n=1 Tax=Gossypium arboreum TaxID=29729 RepID=A0ABR0PEX3_GOSAR|nr:hypothetical protein PVK06_024781 [Gossypium arboreum]